METLKEKLMSLARSKGICSDGYKEMRADDIDSLVDYYTANPDWCLERDFPDLQILSQKFSDQQNKGVFVGRVFHGEMLNDLQAYIFHDCEGSIKVGLNIQKGIIPMLYLANGCRLRIVGAGEIVPKNKSQRSCVPVYIFGRNDVSTKDNKYVKFNRYNHKLK